MDTIKSKYHETLAATVIKNLEKRQDVYKRQFKNHASITPTITTNTAATISLYQVPPI